MSRSVSAPSSVTNTSPCWNGDMVPGSTLMYGSSLTRETLILRDSRIAAREAAAMPFPREETTPPVTKTYLVMTDLVREIQILQEKKCQRCGEVALACEGRGPPLPEHLGRFDAGRRAHHRPVAAAARLRDAQRRDGTRDGGGDPHDARARGAADRGRGGFR